MYICTYYISRPHEDPCGKPRVIRSGALGQTGCVTETDRVDVGVDVLKRT